MPTQPNVKSEEWKGQLNHILWENIDGVENPERPMKAKLQGDLEFFIRTLLQSTREETVRAVLPRERKFVSWDIAEGKDNWVVQFWKYNEDGTRELYQQLNKDSDDGGKFEIDNCLSEIKDRAHKLWGIRV